MTKKKIKKKLILILMPICFYLLAIPICQANSVKNNNDITNLQKQISSKNNEINSLKQQNNKKDNEINSLKQNNNIKNSNSYYSKQNNNSHSLKEKCNKNDDNDNSNMLYYLMFLPLIIFIFFD